jgi:23S rRNA (guanosine2251-2'-O)-methyltransferase
MKNRDQTYVYGTHPVSEALTRAPHAVRHLYFVGGHDTERLIAKAQELNIPFDRCQEDHLPKEIARDTVHQGVVALVSPGKILVVYKQFIENLTITEKTGLVLLDELNDPHNVGAVIRNAAAFGISGVLIPEHRQAPITGTVVKVSAGMAFALPLVSIGNVNTTLRDLKERGFWVYGLSGEGETKITSEKFTKPSVFVLGNESRGIREKTEDLCDFRLSIPIEKNVESLNVASSAAVTFYAWKTQHDSK